MSMEKYQATSTDTVTTRWSRYQLPYRYSTTAATTKVSSTSTTNGPTLILLKGWPTLVLNYFMKSESKALFSFPQAFLEQNLSCEGVGLSLWRNGFKNILGYNYLQELQALSASCKVVLGTGDTLCSCSVPFCAIIYNNFHKHFKNIILETRNTVKGGKSDRCAGRAIYSVLNSS